MPLTSHAQKRASTIALAIIVTCQLMVVLDATVVNIALVPIKHSLHFSTAGLSWVIDAYSLAFGGLLLLGGRAGDVFGRRRMLIIGLTIFTAASLLGGMATTSTMLLLTRAVQGVGAALAAPSTLSLISATFEEGPARNKALGIFTAVSAGGGSLGLILGGALTSWVSWRWVMFINVPIGIAIILLAPRFVPEPPRNGGRLDVAGAALVTGGLASLIYGFIRLAEHGSRSVTLGSFVLSAVLLTSFVHVEKRRAQPLLPMRLLTDRLRGPAYFTMMLVPMVMYGLFFFISQYLEGDLHFSAIDAGFAFLPMTGLIFASSRITPRLVGRIGARPILLFGLFTLGVATLWISKATPTEGYFESLFGPAGPLRHRSRILLLAPERHDPHGRAAGGRRCRVGNAADHAADRWRGRRRRAHQHRRGPRTFRRPVDRRGDCGRRTGRRVLLDSPYEHRGVERRRVGRGDDLAGDGRVSRTHQHARAGKAPPEREGLCNEMRALRYR